MKLQRNENTPSSQTCLSLVEGGGCGGEVVEVDRKAWRATTRVVEQVGEQTGEEKGGERTEE